MKKIRTVRIAVCYTGWFFPTKEILILQKDITSKNPLGLEIPGGKIDSKKNKKNSLKIEKGVACREVKEETGLVIPRNQLLKIDKCDIYFESKNGEIIEREVNSFLVKLPRGKKPKVVINSLPEDKHSDFFWLSENKLKKLITLNKENKVTGKVEKIIAKNSRPGLVKILKNAFK